ncbi:unnamed protein product [Bursaphelenchus xylophilus]|uniref:(pine wood nematode) hypothetical protein n=1 Tax=Bursaphelenchus xylophilus TaxID=6326 RepID=A0A7I8WH97_BURXY|nr:unnamed protein product [Bursaphelenchus xylophilus]CAG9110039.1 unnamed protein product [Bursaphelenchus xylophilus]
MCLNYFEEWIFPFLLTLKKITFWIYTLTSHLTPDFYEFLFKYSSSHLVPTHITCGRTETVAKLLDFGEKPKRFDVALKVISKLPNEIAHEVYRRLSVYQIMALYHHADSSLRNADHRLQDFWAKNQRECCDGNSNAEKIYRVLADTANITKPSDPKRNLPPAAGTSSRPVSNEIKRNVTKSQHFEVFPPPIGAEKIKKSGRGSTFFCVAG